MICSVMVLGKSTLSQSIRRQSQPQSDQKGLEHRQEAARAGHLPSPDFPPPTHTPSFTYLHSPFRNTGSCHFSHWSPSPHSADHSLSQTTPFPTFCTSQIPSSITRQNYFPFPRFTLSCPTSRPSLKSTNPYNWPILFTCPDPPTGKNSPISHFKVHLF